MSEQDSLGNQFALCPLLQDFSEHLICALCTVNLHMEIVSSLKSFCPQRSLAGNTPRNAVPEAEATLCSLPFRAEGTQGHFREPQGVQEWSHKTTSEDASKHQVVLLFDKINAKLNGDSHRETGLSSDQSCNWPQGFFLQMRHLTLDDCV